jgi:hypothetical protein
MGSSGIDLVGFGFRLSYARWRNRCSDSNSNSIMANPGLLCKLCACDMKNWSPAACNPGVIDKRCDEHPHGYVWYGLNTGGDDTLDIGTPMTLDEYVRQRQIELARDLEDKKAVYLDIKFWIMLRDVILGRRTGNSDLCLLEMLRILVGCGKVYCPVSDSTFGELLKQTDANTRKATANLIDELSNGVAIIPFELRVGTELAHFLHSAVSAPADVLHPIKHLVWSKLSYVWGFTHPAGIGFAPEADRVLQREFFDHMWTVSMSEMIDRMGDAMPSSAFSAFEVTAEKLNSENAAHAGQIRSFEQVYLDELQGAIDVFTGAAVDIVGEMIEKRRGHLGELPPHSRAVHERQLKNLLFAAFKQDTTKNALRTLHITACMYAAVRWNKQQQLEANDFFDFRHAAAAIGYCDAFITERSMRAMVTANHLSLDRRYGCKVLANVDESIAYLETLR